MKKLKLTKKQQDFVNYYLETGNGVKSALKAYNTKDYMTAHAIASENLQKPAIREVIDKATKKYGFDDYHLQTIHTNLINNDNPSIAIRALDMAYRLKGKYKAADLKPKKEDRIRQLSDKELDEEIAKILSGALNGIMTEQKNKRSKTTQH